MQRSFLLLQGTASPFFHRLGVALRARGHAVLRINFCGGDLIYSGQQDVLNYTDALTSLPRWYGDLVESENVTDVVMFGDCRDIHQHMHPVAQERNLRVHVFEEGYVRPHWITLEEHGVNGRSKLPRDPDWYLAYCEKIRPIPPSQPTGYNLYERAFHDICYRGANALFAAKFSDYSSHRPHNGLLEYSGLAWRALLSGSYAREASRVTKALLDERRRYYLFPLQLNSDAQIVTHSPFAGVCDAIYSVMHSFSKGAPSDACLVIKNHPLDTGIIRYKKYVSRLAIELDIVDRIRFIDSGHLPTLLEHAEGVVVVNSTVGLSALHHRRPVVVLGHAIYDMQGLTWQGGIDAFWLNAGGPDMKLYHSFLDCVIYCTQINGDFYTKKGIEMAVAGSVRRLVE